LPWLSPAALILFSLTPPFVAQGRTDQEAACVTTPALSMGLFIESARQCATIENALALSVLCLTPVACHVT
jgi:hypothetical protein